jgi:glycosyltransferase involved in cell wall biosynthesis
MPEPAEQEVERRALQRVGRAEDADQGHRRQLRLAFLADINELHTRRWVSAFARRGHRVTVLVQADVAIEPGVPSGVTVRRLPAFGGHRLRPLNLLAARRAIRAAVEDLRADVLHAHYLTGYGWLAWSSGVRPYVISVWGSDIFRTVRDSRAAARLGRLALRSAAVVTSESVDLERATIAAGARADRMIIVQFGVDGRRFFPGPPDEALRARLGLPRRVIFAPRTLLPLYRHEDLIAALPSLPPDVAVLMSARHADPAYRERIVRLAQDVGVADRLRIVEEIGHDEMPAFLRLADVVVSIPETDSAAITMFEALACRIPLVASDVPSIREWLGQVWPAELVPVGDPAAVAAAVQRVLAMSSTERDERTAAGRSLVLRSADHDTHMDAMEAVYRDLAARRARPRERIAPVVVRQ